MGLSREQIFAARAARKPVPFFVEEWGGEVWVKHITVDDQVELAEHNAPSEMPIAVLLACLVDEDEKPIFEPQDAGELSKESFAVILKVFAFAAKLNGLSNKELEDAMASFEVPRTDPQPTDLDSRSGILEASTISAPGS